MDVRGDSPDKPRSGDRTVIEVYVRELDQLFDSLDPSPFHEKGLHRNAHEYIVGIAKELPGHAPTALVVYLEKPVGLPDEERIFGDAIHVYFARRAQLTRRDLRRATRRGVINLAVGIALLVASVVLGQTVLRQLGQGPWATVIRESLLIGGWVAMWRPMDFFLYEMWMIRSDLRVYEHLSRVAVQIVYTGTDGADGREMSGTEVGNRTAATTTTSVSNA